MWKRKALKEKAKAAIKRNYWKAVFVSLIFMCFFGGGSASFTTSGSSANSSLSAALENPVVVIGVLVTFAAVIVAGVILWTILINPFEVGYTKFHINAIADQGSVSDLGSGYDVRYRRNVKALFLRDLYIVLWSLLFVIPGVIKFYEYRMIPYILAENPEINTKDAFKMSKEMMKGNKWKVFVLDLSFILWDILGAFTLGIVTTFYVMPYRQLTSAALYEELKA